MAAGTAGNYFTGHEVRGACAGGFAIFVGQGAVDV